MRRHDSLISTVVSMPRLRIERIPSIRFRTKTILNFMIELLTSLYKLKDEERAGWGLRGVLGPESVADHSWGTALLCLLMAAAAGVDTDRAVSIALVHDIAEAVTGDRPTNATEVGETEGADRKREEEERAMERLFPRGTVSADRIRGLWRDYESRGSREARFVRDMNLIDMCLQALIYERDRRFTPSRTAVAEHPGERLSEFLSSSEARMSTSFGKKLFSQVIERYRAL